MCNCTEIQVYYVMIQVYYIFLNLKTCFAGYDYEAVEILQRRYDTSEKF